MHTLITKQMNTEPMADTLKKCNKCGQVKPLTEYRERKRLYKLGQSSRSTEPFHENACKQCESAASKLYCLKNPHKSAKQMIPSKKADNRTDLKKADSRTKKRYEADMYERCLARFLIARSMIKLGEIKLASDYIQAIDPAIYDYAQHTRRRENDYDYRGLKYLVRYVFIEIELINLKPAKGERRDSDRQFYLDKLQKYGW